MPTMISKPIMPKIVQRLGGSQGSTAVMQITEGVVPVMDVYQLLSTLRGKQTLTSATNTTDTYTVPSGRIWYLKLIYGIRANAGSIGVYLTDPDANQHWFRQGTGSDTEAFVLNGNANLQLPFGWTVSIIFGSGTSGNLRSGIVYEEAELS